MGLCYALGSFADNFYKQAAILIAAALCLKAPQSFATVLFALPFILCSAWAGWIADRVEKKYIVIASKALELVALLLGAFSIYHIWWPGILAVMFTMGLQSTLFSPALNGSIPELFDSATVPKVNGIIKLASTVAILAGIALAGVFLDLTPDGGITTKELTQTIAAGELTPEVALEHFKESGVFGRTAAGIFIVCLSCVGLIISFTLKRRPKGSVTLQRTMQKFPWSGPLDSLKHLGECKKDKLLYVAMMADACFYGVAALAVISIANLSKSFGYSDTVASLLSAAIMVGIAVGAIIAGRFKPEQWQKVLIPSATGMAICMFGVFLAAFLPESAASINFFGELRLTLLFLLLFGAGICGGIYIVPVASFVQVRPPMGEKGRIIATSNFLSFISIAVFGAASLLINQLPPAVTFIVYGAVLIIFAFTYALPRFKQVHGTTLLEKRTATFGAIARLLLGLRYKVTESGLDKIEAEQYYTDENGRQKIRPILFLPNHPALIDPVLVFSRLGGIMPRALADKERMSDPLTATLARLMRFIKIPDMQKGGRQQVKAVRAALNSIMAALQDGDNVLLYPSGKIYRSTKEEIGANLAAYHVVSKLPHVRVVLVRTTGLWGSSFSYANGENPKFFKLLSNKLRVLLANILLFTPRRHVKMEFIEPADLPRTADKLSFNHYLEEFYNKTEKDAEEVPLYFWQGSTPRPLVTAERVLDTADLSAITDEIKEKVSKIIREATDMPQDAALNSTLPLSMLGLDSLAMLEIVTAVENEFGTPVPSMEKLVTVQDLFLAAAGKLFDAKELEARQVPDAWFKAENDKDATKHVSLPENSSSLVQDFLIHTRKKPFMPLLADRANMYSRFKVLVGAMLFAAKIKKVKEARVGIMLPATPVATIVWLAAQMAGKECVMLNWTVGKANLQHCIKISGIKHVFTASALLDQLDRQGVDLEGLEVEWVELEDLASTISRKDKFSVLVRSALYCAAGVGLRLKKIPENAVILFTSGSESAPKGVPLSHQNIRANASAVAQALEVEQRERLLAMLPPFHSFGFMVNIALPLGAGLSAAFHPNPTESAPLVFMVRDYKLSLTGATPTFIESMLLRAQGTEHLASLRYAFVGAEKCPEHIYTNFKLVCPQAALCEGYGITECSPVIAVNRPRRIVVGSIGKALPGVELVVVDESAAELQRVSSGVTGMLLAKGKNIFNGYLEPKPDTFVEFEGEKWYRTGDLVSLSENGDLFFQGRLSRFVKIGGEMISLPQVEAVLQQGFTALTAKQLPAELQGKPFLVVESSKASEDAGKPELTVFTTLNLDKHELNQCIKAAGLPTLYSIKHVVKRESIPVLGTGKVDYRSLKNLAV